MTRQSTGLDTADKQRYMREYQSRRRGAARCYKSEADTACVMLAYEAGEITEGVAARLTGLTRVLLRERKVAMIAEAVKMAGEVTT